VLRQLKDLESRDGVSYLHFSALPVARTKSYAAGELNIDLTDDDEVVGIEVLSLGPNELKALTEIATAHHLSLNKLIDRR
jgi:hypothetical protein